MGWRPDQFPPRRAEWLYGDRVVNCFTERPRNLWALLSTACAAKGSQELLVGGSERVSGAAALSRAEATARALAALGVRPGERVVMVMGNTPDFVLLLFAIFRLGALAVPLSIRSSATEVAWAIANTSSRLLICDRDRAPLIPAPGDRPGCDACLFEDLPAAPAQPLPEADSLPAEDEVALILHTSGTTGKPKGAMLTHLGLIHSAMQYNAALDLRPDDRILAAVPLNHVTGIAALISTALFTGASLFIMETFKAAACLDIVERERITYALMVPAMYNLCLLQPDFPTRDLQSWRLAAYGGAPMPEPTIRRLTDAVPALTFANCYGATECIVAQVINPPVSAVARRECIGLPLPGTEVLIMSDDGVELPDGETGELWLRGPGVVRGYWNNPAETARAFVAGFWRSGDLGRREPDGFIRLLDRAKDMINRGGLKIYSAELENVLISHPLVSEAAALARPCPVLGERVHAVVVTTAPLAAEELTAWARSQLSDYKLPETLDIRAEMLPRNANGKIDKVQLRREMAPG